MCCSGFLKIMMFIFNGGIFLAGAAILGVGVWVKVDSGSFLGILDNLEGSSNFSQLVNISYVFIAVGAVLVLLGFLGCCGAIMESRCMLLTFFIIVLIIFIVEVAGAVVLLVFRDLAENVFEDLALEVKKSIRREYGNDVGLTELWNTTMKELKCCGYKNYTDFEGSPYNTQDGGDWYPPPCCNTTGAACSLSGAQNSEVEGCFNALLQLIEKNALIVAAVALGILALEIAAMVVSMILYRNIGTKG